MVSMHFSAILVAALWVFYQSVGSIPLSDAVESVNGSAFDTQENAVRREGVDSALLKYAAMALTHAKTGAIYNVSLPLFLAGIQTQAIRLRSGSFKRRGLAFNEFSLPQNASFNSNSTTLVMVYRKIFHFTVYTLPAQYQFGGPVVGIITYSPSNPTTVDPSLPELGISLPINNSINISLPLFSSSLPNPNPTPTPTPNPIPLCAFFSANGSIFLSNLTTLPNLCTSSTLGDFALVVQTSSTPPIQSPSPSAAPTARIQAPSSPNRKASKNWKLIVGATCLSLAGLAFLVAIVLIGIKFAESLKHSMMAHVSSNEEALETSLIGAGRAPTAAVVRTKPTLEIDMAHFTS